MSGSEVFIGVYLLQLLEYTENIYHEKTLEYEWDDLFKIITL